MPKENWKSLEESRLRAQELQERIKLLQTLRTRLERLAQCLETMMTATAQCFKELNLPEEWRPNIPASTGSYEGARPHGMWRSPQMPESGGRNENSKTDVLKPELLTKQDAAKLLQVSVRTIDALRKCGLPYFQLGHLIRFRRDELTSWYEQFTKNQENPEKSQE